jgi:hypothetical protein
MREPRQPELLPSIADLLRRAGALERVPGVDAATVSRQPVFQSLAWRRSIAEFLRWSGTTPQPDGGASVFELVLGHGRAGARALFAAYRHDRLERAATFEEADAQLEAVRTLVNMAAHWVQAIDWDLHDAPRLSSEEFRGWRRGERRPSQATTSPGRAERNGEGELSDLVTRFLFEENERGSRETAIPVFPNEGSPPKLWRSMTDEGDPDGPGPRRRTRDA